MREKYLFYKKLEVKKVSFLDNIRESNNKLGLIYKINRINYPLKSYSILENWMEYDAYWHVPKWEFKIDLVSTPTMQKCSQKRQK